MAPFVIDGELKHAQEVIRDLGDFSAIRSPAKCAARIGQTFSDATDTVTIRQCDVREMPDIDRGGRTFTDGCGTMSQQMLTEVWNVFEKTRKKKASLLQIRLRGAKGMLSLDTTIRGKFIYLRESMIKFPGSKDMELEICGAAYRPLPMFLNRQFIKILEDLGVPANSFLDLQEHAIAKLRDVMVSPAKAAGFLETQMITAAQAPVLIRLLEDIKLSFRDDDFLGRLVEVASLAQMRDMKYRGRIPIDNAHLVHGICDETGFLKEGEVYVVIRDERGFKEVLEGDLMVTRSPALHPGDIQIARGVHVPATSMLQGLHNCIVFSQHGTRDLPSMLSAGDLDGDLYNVMFEPKLWPKVTYPAADYERLPALDIGRPVEADDMTNFFLLFMESDQLGYISNTHQQVADQMEHGTLSSECILLAGMASTAVDFSKTGMPVDMSQMKNIRYAKGCKPDFMARAPRMLVGTTNVTLEGAIDAIVDEDQDDDGDQLSKLEPDVRRVRYYESKKVLGQLYRAIDEQKFLDSMRHELRGGASSGSESRSSLMASVWSHVQQACYYMSIQYSYQIQEARDISDSYYDNLVDVAHTYSPDAARRPLSELEVFAGIVMGRDGGLPNKRVRESNRDMKEQFGRVVATTIERIVRVDVLDNDDEAMGEEYWEEDSVHQAPALSRSVACFAFSMQGEEPRFVPYMGKLISFRYVAAAVCLKQIAKSRERSLYGDY